MRRASVPVNDVGPRDTTPEGTDTNTTISHHQVAFVASEFRAPVRQVGDTSGRA